MIATKKQTETLHNHKDIWVCDSVGLTANKTYFQHDYIPTYIPY